MNKKKELRTIPYFDKRYSYEEYVRIQALTNRGTQCCIYKDKLESLCEENKIPFKKDVNKEQLYDMLISHGFTAYDFAEGSNLGITDIGVTSQIYQQEFGITHKEVKKLEKKGFLKITGSYRSRAYGKYIYPPLYSAWQFVTLAEEDIRKALE